MQINLSHDLNLRPGENTHGNIDLSIHAKTEANKFLRPHLETQVGKIGLDRWPAGYAHRKSRTIHAKTHEQRPLLVINTAVLDQPKGTTVDYFKNGIGG